MRGSGSPPNAGDLSPRGCDPRPSEAVTSWEKYSFSSTSPEGVDNLAPHSVFTVASVHPPIVQFTSVGKKDSLRNIRARGEFLVMPWLIRTFWMAATHASTCWNGRHGWG
ncbi:flavin reductase [Arthrobacter pascens]|nr:flavin reductase [Arthrobacter pascens]